MALVVTECRKTRQFTNNWFEQNALPVWKDLIPRLRPARILEIGSYEGASACFLIDSLSCELQLEIFCLDTWSGGIEHASAGIDMAAVESRFHVNLQLASDRALCRPTLRVRKGLSAIELSKLIAEGLSGYFDFVYIDGSHQAPDVLVDAVLSFQLLRVGGVLAFDDYLWSERLPGGVDLLRCPKPAIDAFSNLFMRKVKIMNIPYAYQQYLIKISE
ncbi:MAG: class I SAM-dependent methyltransferase [Synechococcus sp.]|nr:class I SAM-dependent methyltransferase [Synechococcus sp.]